MKYESKKALIAQIEGEHATLVELVDSIPPKLRESPGVWGDGWNVKDLLAHLTEWEQMFLRWHRDGTVGKTPDMPAKGYKWNEIRALNRAIREKHKDVSWRRVRTAFDASYQEVLALAKKRTENQLLSPGQFAWTKKYPLTTYLGANSCSHYRFAIKALRRWLKLQNLSK